MGDIGAPELIIILVIIIVLFGPGRLQGADKALGESIRSFRQAIRDEDAPGPPDTAPRQQPPDAP